jgi:hypothetical protein
MSGRADGWSPAHAVVAVRLTLLIGFAALLLVFRGELSGRLAGAEIRAEPPVDAIAAYEVEWKTAWNQAATAWKMRERAVAAGDLPALAEVAESPAFLQDVRGSRWGRGGRLRLVRRGYMRVLPRGPDAVTMLAAVSVPNGPGWRGSAPWGTPSSLVAFVRSEVDSPWQVAFEVPFQSWPWVYYEFRAEPRESDLNAVDALRPWLDGRRLQRIVAVPLVNRRTLVCAAVGARSNEGGSAQQFCIVALDDDPGKTYLLGSGRAE